jgi:hypothetical protein
MLTRIFFSIAIVLPNLAWAQTSHQAALTKFAAKAVYSERRCPSLKANLGALAVIGANYGVTPDDWAPGGKLHRLFKAQMAVMEAENDSSDPKIFCAAVEFVFGPDGARMPGLLTKRN